MTFGGVGRMGEGFTRINRNKASMGQGSHSRERRQPEDRY